MPSISLLAKLLLQLGPRPLALYGLYRLGLHAGCYRRQPPAGEHRMLPRPLFAFPSSDVLLAVLDAPARAALFAEADEIVAGRVRLFGGDPVPLQLSFSEPLQHWTAYEIGRAALPVTDFSVHDVKLIWEPARFGWAFALGRAYRLSGNEKYAQAFWRHTETFLDANPPYLGPHWMNGQEAALRILAFTWAMQVLAASPASTTERLARLAGAVAAHASRVEHTLLYARAQNNNHLISEAAGLYTASLALPEHPRAARWRRMGWHWLNWAFQHQIGSFGEYIQHSTNYHRLMLHCALWVNAIRMDDWPRATREALGRASAWLFSLLDFGSGQTPNLGANDGALILPLASSAFGDYRPTVQAAARAFLHSGLPSGPWDELSLWLNLPAPQKTLEPADYLSDNLRGKESWAYLRTTTFKSRLGHMDQLHLDLWWRGLNVAQDAGTYSYNAPPPWDNPLLTSRVHNTVTMDGRDQMTRAGRFLTLDWFPAYATTILETNAQVLQKVTARYKTRRLRHERTVTVYLDGRWLVADELTASDKAVHTFRLHWLLPDWPWELAEDRGDMPGVFVRLQSPQGPVGLRLASGASECRLIIIRAGEVIYGGGMALPFEGWISHTYGRKTPALSLAFECTARWKTTLLSEFMFPA